MTIMSEREFDFIIFGANEVTGQHVLRNLVKWLELEKKPRWIAIAGPHKAQLKVSLTEVSIQMDRNLNDVTLILVDFNDEANLATICARSKIILNAYSSTLNLLDREKLAKACIQKRTHMLDINDETEYLDLLQLKYHEAAKAAGVYLIGSINSNCVPIDLGVDFLKQQFLPAGRLHSTESYISFQSNNQLNHPQQLTNPSIIHKHFNSHLIQSIFKSKHQKDAISSIYHYEENNNNIVPSNYSSPSSSWISSKSPASSVVSASSLPSGQQLKSNRSLIRALIKCLPRKNRELASWSIPITITNIVPKSQQWFYQAYREPPTRFNQHLIVSQLPNIIFLVFTLIYLTLLNWFTFSRKLLNAHPSLLTLGYLRHSRDTTEERYHRTSSLTHSSVGSISGYDPSFSIHLVGAGWDSPSDSADGHYKFPPNRTIRISIAASDPDCEISSLILIQSGLTLLEESGSMPYKGGCLTPAFAFRYTTLRERLNQRGLEFKMLHH